MDILPEDAALKTLIQTWRRGSVHFYKSCSVLQEARMTIKRPRSSMLWGPQSVKHPGLPSDMEANLRLCACLTWMGIKSFNCAFTGAVMLKAIYPPFQRTSVTQCSSLFYFSWSGNSWSVMWVRFVKPVLFFSFFFFFHKCCCYHHLF